jgi:D-xylose transport system permease protein
VQLYLLGDTGAISFPCDSGLVHFTQLAFVPA